MPEMAEESVLEIVRMVPDMPSAVEAISSASEALNFAKEKFNQQNYGESIHESKSAIRLASAAVLFRDGYIASTLNATIRYLEEHYPDKFPNEDWKKLELIPDGEGPGLMNIIIRMLKNSDNRKRDAEHAISVAEKFLSHLR
ncbi:hypothetical protein KKF81_00270 [Candidatus Micrarchaeota archaeon]|nr:hypothetical protein [Candidatus Micrarchaeota archaeon]MBU1165352.1 hypothetical protein [Candidatus Micrarchaeota archaeon]MBU1886706.1 hypothetical protein [Candidatus Micrarchaeota archaeon]